jgi:peptidoglycan/LPS O-acetylase OafA/YrhL
VLAAEVRGPNPIAPLATRPSAGDRRRFVEINAMRFFGILAVVLVHLTLVRPPRPGSIRELLVNHFPVAVTLFFVISGFFLFRPFVQALQSGDRILFRSYAANRVLRIIPAWFFVNVVLFVVIYKAQDFGRLVRNLTFVSLYSGLNDRLANGAWSLHTEVVFYAFLPAFALALLKVPIPKRIRVSLVAILVLGIASSVYQGFGIHKTWLQANLEGHASAADYAYFTILSKFQVFAAGMILAIAQVRWGDRRFGLRGISILAVGAIAFMAVGLYGLDAYPPLGDSFEGIGIAMLLGVVVFSPKEWLSSRFLALPALVFLGEISYGIYLWHTPIIHYMDSQNWLFTNYYLAAVEALAVTVAVASASYFVIERPALRLKRSWTARSPKS